MAELDFRSFKGLTEAEAAARLQAEGFNELPQARRRSVLAIAFEVVREPMFLLLVACGLIYLLMGDRQEACMLLGFVFVVMGITFYQERKTERALEALRDLSSPRALVIRGGRERRVSGREVARGDTLVLAEGDRVPAAAVVRACHHLAVDESLLTGESVPVRKRTAEAGATAEAARPGGDDLPFVYSGTLVVQGRAVAEAVATGAHTELGRIGKALQEVESGASRLQQETSRLVTRLAILGLALCVAVVAVYGFTRHDWLHGFLAGLTLAMALLPEEFPVVLTVFLALGAWRIAQRRVLTRRVPAVETLGSATVLCVDKTGTLTMNQMTVQQLYARGQVCHLHDRPGQALTEEFHTLVEYSILASQRDPFDPMEKAVREMGLNKLAGTEHLHETWTLVREYPLSRELMALTHVWRSPDGGQYLIAAKGAPEAIGDLCHLPESEKAELARQVESMAAEGFRGLGVARAAFDAPALPGGQHDFAFGFLGLLGFSDPVRATVPEAVRECHAAGIRVVMITGDYPATALHIAREIGLPEGGRVIAGPELQKMSDAELAAVIGETHIFARVVPEQKLRIVDALKAAGEVVAMTGDGVNDAPALKSAHIGIAMGGRGTDVARESAALVLLDDDFSSIVGAVRLGRRIFDNLKKAMAYIFAVHVPIAGMSLIPVLLGWPLVLLPVHIVFLELVIDPACSVVFEAEPEETGVMRRRPRPPAQPLFDGRLIGLSLLQGFVVFLIVLGVFWVGRRLGQSAEECRAMAFTTLVVSTLALILTNRSWTEGLWTVLHRPNRPQGWVTGGTLAVLALTLYTPYLRDLFRFAPLSLLDVAVCLGAGLLGIAWFEGFKMFRRAQPPEIAGA